MLPNVGIVILNWNGWADTLECLESIFRLEGADLHVVVCDNGSHDGSVERVRDWAEGRQAAGSPGDERLRRCVEPPVAKPLPFVEYDRRTAEAGGTPEGARARLAIVRNGENLGFTAGNNVGLRYLQARGLPDFVWLLNNDTVVAPGALDRMLQRLRSDPDAGICGATLLYYSDPGIVQARGGFTYDPWRGRARQLGQFEPAVAVPEEESRRLERAMHGVQGASVFVTRQFLERVGLLEEDYFIYFEEQDWAMRARAAGFRLAYAPDAVVYHKEGAATGGSSQRPREMSEFSEYHSMRSRVLFTRRFFPHALPAVYLAMGLSLLKRLRHRQYSRARALLRAAAAGLARRGRTVR